MGCGHSCWVEEDPVVCWLSFKYICLLKNCSGRRIAASHNVLQDRDTLSGVDNAESFLGVSLSS